MYLWFRGEQQNPFIRRIPCLKLLNGSLNSSRIHGTCEQSIGRNCKPCPSTQYPRTLVTIISDRIRRILSMSGTLGHGLYKVCVQQMTRPDYPVCGRGKFRGIVPQFRVNGEVSRLIASLRVGQFLNKVQHSGLVDTGYDRRVLKTLSVLAISEILSFLKRI